jgi:hypothetical protein
LLRNTLGKPIGIVLAIPLVDGVQNAKYMAKRRRTPSFGRFPLGVNLRSAQDRVTTAPAWAPPPLSMIFTWVKRDAVDPNPIFSRDAGFGDFLFTRGL